MRAEYAAMPSSISSRCAALAALETVPAGRVSSAPAVAAARSNVGAKHSMSFMTGLLNKMMIDGRHSTKAVRQLL
jgi:hypothetical protein